MTLVMGASLVGCGDDSSASDGGMPSEDSAMPGADGGMVDTGGGMDAGVAGDAGPPVACAMPEMHSGEATYYDFADGSGNCSFPATPDDLMVGAMNQTDYAGSAACGTCARVTGPEGTINIRIVDRCPECAPGDIDLSPSAFEQLAAVSLGRVPIAWAYESCEVSGPLIYHFKDGSSQWWTAVQVRNHRNGIARFEYQAGDGSFVEVARENYNFFVEPAGMGVGPLTFRVTDVFGNVVTDTGIPVLDDADAVGASQFPPCE